MTEHERTIPTRHSDISVRESDGAGPPVLLIHGNSSCKKVFRHQFSAFGSRYRLIAMDLPGHGESSDAEDPDASYTQPAYAEAAIDVLEACGAENTVVVGWSLGGHIGIEMIGRLSSMSGLVITGTPPCGPGEEEVNAAFTPLPHMSFTSKEVFTQDDAEAYARYTCGIGLPLDPELVAAVRRTDGKARRIMWNHWTTANQGCPQIRSVETWEKPLAVIQGEDEAFFDNGYFDRIRFRNLWGGKVHTVAGAGHAPFRERPVEYNEILERYLIDVACHESAD